MKMIYRNFFYAVGVIFLVDAGTFDQHSVQLGDFIALIQSPNFYSLVGVVTAILCCLEFLFSGHSSSVVLAGCIDKLKSSEKKSEHRS